jgi:hypothetical protein
MADVKLQLGKVTCKDQDSHLEIQVKEHNKGSSVAKSNPWKGKKTSSILDAE